ncbi:MAG: hypothetical protein FJZ57_02380 [Chlamydiae bacterium]|nr:hypothetical protein [Chlamydiota bacterium]
MSLNPINSFFSLISLHSEATDTSFKCMKKCLDSLNSGQKEEALQEFSKIPENAKNYVFEAAWRLSGCPSEKSSDPLMRTKSHPNFGRLAFLGIKEGGVDRSCGAFIRLCSASIGLQKYALEELKKDSKGVKADEAKQFLTMQGHQFNSDIRSDVEEKLIALDSIYTKLQTLKQVLESAAPEVEKCDKIKEYVAELNSFFCIRPKLDPSQYKSHEKIISHYQQKIECYSYPLFLLSVSKTLYHLHYLHRDESSAVKDAPVPVAPVISDRDRFARLGVMENQSLKEQILSRSPINSAKNLLMAGDSKQACKELKKNPGLANQVFKYVWMIAGRPQGDPLFGENTFKASPSEGAVDGRMKLSYKKYALEVFELYENLKLLSQSLDFDSGLRFSELYQFKAILPEQVKKNLDAYIQEEDRGKGDARNYKILENMNIANPDIDPRVKKTAVLRLMQEFQEILMKIEDLSQNRHTITTDGALLSKLQSIVLPLGSLFLEVDQVEKICSQTSVLSFIDECLKSSSCLHPFLASAVGFSFIDTTLTERAKTYHMMQDLAVHRVNNAKGITTLSCGGRDLPAITLYSSALINTAKQPFVSVGTNPFGREIILLDPESKKVQNFYTCKIVQPNSSILTRETTLVEKFQKITQKFDIYFSKYTHIEDYDDRFTEQWKKEHPIEDYPQYYYTSDINGESTPIIPIDDYIKSRFGVCRHRSILASYVINRLMMENSHLFDVKGHVLHMRENTDTGGSHAWLWFVSDANPIIHIDPMWNEVVVLDNGPKDEYSRLAYIQNLKDRVKMLPLH